MAMNIDDPDEVLREAISVDVKGCFASSLTSRIDEGAPLTFGLLEWHDETEELNSELVSFPRSEQLAAIPWTYSCTHTGDFLGVPPTYLDIELRGATFVDVRNGDGQEGRRGWTFYRYVDYLGALQQIGVTTATRPVANPERYADWRQNWDDRRAERNRAREEAIANQPAE